MRRPSQKLRRVVDALSGAPGQASHLLDELEALRETANEAGDEHLVNTRVHLQEVVKLHAEYTEAFDRLQEADYYSAWKLLEQCELNAARLKSHLSKPLQRRCLVQFIADAVERFQSLYPYRIFLSPEFVVKGARCSICGAEMSLRQRCGHDPGQLYDGEYCAREIYDAEFLGVSFVDNPAQKFSVPFKVNPESGETHDHYNYSNLEYLVKRLNNPFAQWGYEKTQKTYCRSVFEQWQEESDCPCLSGEQFGDCCWGMERITVPHLRFDLPPGVPRHLQHDELIKRKTT